MNPGLLNGFGRQASSTRAVRLNATGQIVNSMSAGGVISSVNVAGGGIGRQLLSGVLAPNTPKVMLSVVGRGEVPLLSLTSVDSSNRTIRLIVVVDGQASPSFDAAYSGPTAPNLGLVAAGHVVGSSFSPGNPIRFNQSLLVSIASSVAETDKLALNYLLMRCQE